MQPTAQALKQLFSDQCIKSSRQLRLLLVLADCFYTVVGELREFVCQDADGYLQASLSDNSLKATSQLWEGISLQQQGQASAGQQLIDQATRSELSLASELPQIKALLPK